MPTAIEREAQAIKSEAKKILLIVVIISLLVYLLSGTRQIGQEQTGLVVRFGKVEKEKTEGLHWGYPWPIEKLVRIPTGASHSLEVSNFNLSPQLVSQRLTQLRQHERFKTLPRPAMAALVKPYLVTADLNVIHLDLNVLYQITDPEAYYYAAGDVPDMTQTRVQTIAQNVIANALIQTLAEMEVMNVLGEGQSAIQQAVASLAQEQFDNLDLGIHIDAVQINKALVPTELQSVFDRVTTVQSEKNTAIAIAQIEANQIVNQARAKSSAILSKAQTYRQATISQAKGDAQRFTALIQEYQDKGEVVRHRLQLEKLAEVAPYLKAPIVHAIRDTRGKQKLVITIPGKPE